MLPCYVRTALRCGTIVAFSAITIQSWTRVARQQIATEVQYNLIHTIRKLLFARTARKHTSDRVVDRQHKFTAQHRKLEPLIVHHQVTKTAKSFVQKWMETTPIVFEVGVV